MMKFVRAEREGDWPLHLCAVEEMLPYFFASSMHDIVFTTFDLCSDFIQHYSRSSWPVSMSCKNGFWNAIWSHLFIETTYMRYDHGPAGIVGSAMDESTLAI